MSTLHPTFKFPGSDDVVFDDVLASRDFVADDLMVGVSVLTGFTTSGAIRTGVMTEMLPGVGIRFDNPDQNGIFWREMWQHLGDCECVICCEHMPRTMARLAAIRSSTEVDDMPQPNGSGAVADSFPPLAEWGQNLSDELRGPPAPQLRRTDSGSDYGHNGYPDCEFWERSGYDPLFIATAADYNGHGPDYPRVYVANIMSQADKSLMDAATLRAWDRQWDDLVEAQADEELRGEMDDQYEVMGWGGTGRPSFLEPPLSPPRVTLRPVICPDAPVRSRRNSNRRDRGSVSPIQPVGFDSVDADNKEDNPSFWSSAITVRAPLWHLGATLMAVSVYMFMVVWQLEECKKCLRG